MPYGAGFVAATQAQPAEIVDPRRFATAELAEVYRHYPHIGKVLPAVGYHPAQMRALQQTLNAADADIVVSATPCDLAALIEIDKAVVRARYEFAETCEPGLTGSILAFLKQHRIIAD